MDFRQASGLIKKGTVKPVYLFYGEEDFLQEHLLEQILHVLQQKGREFMLEKIDGMEIDLGQVVQLSRQGTLFSEGRLLFIYNSPLFGTKGEKKKGKSSVEEEGEGMLLSLLEEEPSDLVLIFSVSQADKRKKLVKSLEKAGCLVEFPLLRGKALFSWIRNELKAEKKEIEEEALFELVERSGENLRLLKNELEKIATYLPPDEAVITLETIRRMVPQSSQGNIFKLVEALGRKDMEGAWYHLHKMLQQGEPPLIVLAMIARQFRLLYRALEITESGGTQRELASALNVPGFAARELVTQLRGFDEQFLARILEYLKQIDLEIKSGYRGDTEALEHLVLQLSAGDFSRPRKTQLKK